MLLLWQYRVVLVVLFIVLWDNSRGEETRRWRFIHRAAQAVCLFVLIDTWFGCPTC